MSVQCSLDPATRIALVLTKGTASGRDVARAILAEVAARPELASWDWIHDLRDASGDVSHEDVTGIAEAFGETPPARSALTVFITFDPHFGLWARTMDPLFPNRRHVVATSLEGAVAAIRRNRVA